MKVGLLFKKDNKNKSDKRKLAADAASSANPSPLIAPKRKAKEAFILLRPHITEKAADSMKFGVYTFVVASGANKSQIRRAVESKYGVHVTSVRIANMIGKLPKRFRVGSFRPGFKKAMVALGKGEKIELT